MFVVASLYFAATVAAIFVATIYLDMCITSAVKQIKRALTQKKFIANVPQGRR